MNWKLVFQFTNGQSLHSPMLEKPEIWKNRADFDAKMDKMSTEAGKLPQVARTAVKERAARLRHKGDTALGRHLQSQIGGEVELLIERAHLGRTPQFTEMELAQPARPGRMVRARVTASAARCSVCGSPMCV